MKRRKKILVIAFLLCGIFSIFIQPNDSHHKILKSKKEENLVSTNAISMLYETEEGSGEYQMSEDSTWPSSGYIFNETLSKCENGGTLSWNEETKRVIMQTNFSDKCYVYFDKEKSGIYLQNYIKENIYTGIDGENNIYHHDGNGTYGKQEAGDDSYRYSGANPDNYVCFGSDEEICPNDNIYRIIGIFENEIKLIKYEYANSDLLGIDGEYANRTYDNTSSNYYKGTKSTIDRFYWSTSKSNAWSESNLNKINLNINFLNYLDTQNTKWTKLISEHTWKVGGNNLDNIINVPLKTSFENELINPALNVSYNAKIGLMYVSDYGYAANPVNWETNMKNLNTDLNRNNNWMFIGLKEWTITRRSDSTNGILYVFNIHETGYVSDIGFVTVLLDDFSVRPVFYLNSKTIYVSGTGTRTDPFRIN